MELSDGVVTLRPLRYADADAWDRLRRANEHWLTPWEATTADPAGGRPTYRQYVRQQARAARTGTDYGFAVVLAGDLIGHLTVSSVTMGSLCSAAIGYWISEHLAGRGYIPRAVALASDFCFFELGLHRVEVNIRPENQASLRVVAKLGFREEGLRKRYLHIDGRWCDHLSFALTREDVGAGLVARLAGRTLGGADTPGQ
ncbi:MAG: GNAT family N-acetyltransferase [Beutenbergiaceae bacterium]